MKYSNINNIIGWCCFAIATSTYILTTEPSVSFWDCGEFIASALKMQVVHQPGAPLFLMIQRFFSLFAFGDLSKAAYFMNVGSAVVSGATILFLFWTITALAKKVILKGKKEINHADLVAIMGAGFVGALAYTFSDSFWFSAVESEVYALSSLFTAIVFWGMLKWEANADEPRADRWLLFIAYMIGLSIGIHLLNLLTIPAITFIYYFKKNQHPTVSGLIKTAITGIVILGVVQYAIIQHLVSLAAYFDLFFVNTLGTGFGMGVVFFALLLLAVLVIGIKYSIRNQKKTLNLVLLAIGLLIFGYSSFAMIVIRAKAKTNLNNSDPDNVFSLLSYLNREQYGDRPLFFGPNYNSSVINVVDGKTIYRKGAEKYEETGKKREAEYDKVTPFPRMYSNDEGHIEYYKQITQNDDEHFPGFLDNLKFFFTYQTNHMYLRYFMWNFVGRQNDAQGHGSLYEGQWLSGIKALDALRLGNQKNLPPSIVDNKAYNRFFFLPLIMGLLGAVWHFKRYRKDAGIVMLFFFFTGMAIVLYLNQKPLEPRERDYAYAGSFYAFAIWIGFGVLALRQLLLKKVTPLTGGIMATIIGTFAAPSIMAVQGWDDHDRSSKMMAHDIAFNYLESCAPNAVLFTYGDNDTYPLWYLQEVENVRPDVRLVNLSLLDADWYINAMKRKQNQSEALPISMKTTQYAEGTRDVLYYHDKDIKGSVELKDMLEILLSENEDDKLLMSNGKKENFLPSKNFRLTVDKPALIKQGLVDTADFSRICDALKWTYNKDYLSKGTLAILDILLHNEWKRPICFTKTVPGDLVIGLDRYLYDEGVIQRLMPLIPETDHENDRVNSDALYHNVMNKFKWGNVKHAKYLDRESKQTVSILNNVFDVTINNLLNEGKIKAAGKVFERYFERIPVQCYDLPSVISNLRMAKNLYRLNDIQRANELIERSADFTIKELQYLIDLSKSKEGFVAGHRFKLGWHLMHEMIRLSGDHQQNQLVTALNARLEKLQTLIGPEIK